MGEACGASSDAPILYRYANPQVLSLLIGVRKEVVNLVQEDKNVCNLLF